MDWQALGRSLIIAGLVIALVGGGLLLAGRLPFLGRLPGDIAIRRGQFGFYFPVTTCLLISALLTIVLHFINKK